MIHLIPRVLINRYPFFNQEYRDRITTNTQHLLTHHDFYLAKSLVEMCGKLQHCVLTESEGSIAVTKQMVPCEIPIATDMHSMSTCTISMYSYGNSRT